ncbi:MAG: calcium-translocating P-type ATPase, PMCA-type [Deltaproteobacteria bacterium]|jgi:Ca2+-transporting ATPase|nr:calcium-translocating P-type ATPase, PMCA-type [Deltaproteobacteria bacterium]
MTTDDLSPPRPAASSQEFPGLTPEEVEESRRLNGANVLTPPPRDPWWKLYLEKFEDPIIRILLVAAVIAILAGIIEGRFAEGIGIVIAVLLATTLGFINEYKAGQEFDILNKVSDDDPIKVIRGGAYGSVPKKDLVVGDVASLEQGEEIPADGEVLEAVSFQVNEASLTGESLPVTKKALGEAVIDESAAYQEHQLLRGTFVSDGRALFRVTRVGDASEIGRTARSAAEETENVTPLNRQLGRLGRLIGVLGFAVALLIFAALTVRSGIQGDLGRQVDLGPEIVLADGAGGPSPAALSAALAELGNPSDHKIVRHLTETGWEYYLSLPLANGEIYFLVSVFLALVVALSRVWIPVVQDAFELLGKKRPEIGWIEREGLAPWLQALGGACILAGALVGIGLLSGILSGGIATWLPGATVLTLLRFFMVAVTIIVVAVPEGLPMSVTLSLAYSMRKMTAANNLVRRMHACETIGAATVICSDKTGTLTMNQMKVNRASFPFLGDAAGPPQGPDWDLLSEAICANSTANLAEDESGKLLAPLGNPTEAALLLWLEGLGVGYKSRRAGFALLGQLTFSTERKYMATLGVSASGANVLYVKGAPEIVLGRSASKKGADGGEAPLTAQERESVAQSLKDEQARGMRTLGLARKVLPEAPSDASGEAIQALADQNDLVFLGFFSIADPTRPEVPPAVKACAKAGVKVKMVTGDSSVTALEIGKEIGVVAVGEDARGAALSGDEFMALGEEEAMEVVEGLKIMSRAKPLAKQRLVNLLQKKGEVVAVTGDGSNDAPALNHADVGLAMGITGTSVAKEAADIILLDDSFASIVKAIMWGRSIYANIQKFILFQLTINVLALGVALLGPFLGIQLPLTVTQMLWVNLIMDTFAALALASEPPSWDLMDKPPRNPEAFIVTPAMARFIFAVGGFFLLLFLILAVGLKNVFPMDLDAPGGRHNLSIFFTTFVFIQFWNLFNARAMGRNQSALANLRESKMFALIIAVIAVGQILMTELGGEVFRTDPLSVKEWALIIVLTSPVLWFGEIVRFVRRSRQRAEGPVAAR